MRAGSATWKPVTPRTSKLAGRDAPLPERAREERPQQPAPVVPGPELHQRVGPRVPQLERRQVDPDAGRGAPNPDRLELGEADLLQVQRGAGQRVDLEAVAEDAHARRRPAPAR
jgi:hypothetical protein